MLERSIKSGSKDFEDAVQYYSGEYGEVNGLVTRNTKDYKRAKLPIYTPDELWGIVSISQSREIRKRISKSWRWGKTIGHCCELVTTRGLKEITFLRFYALPYTKSTHLKCTFLNTNGIAQHTQRHDCVIIILDFDVKDKRCFQLPVSITWTTKFGRWYSIRCCSVASNSRLSASIFSFSRNS